MEPERGGGGPGHFAACNGEGRLADGGRQFVAHDCAKADRRTETEFLGGRRQGPAFANRGHQGLGVLLIGKHHLVKLARLRH